MRKTVYWIEGDGIGPDVWKSARPVIDEAIRLSYGDGRGFDWKELLAGEKALKETGTLLPDETLAALRGAELAIKGPLGTPVGTGFRSLNVTLRQTLDLYACIRPIRYFEGIESPVKHPERVDMIVFRENTEDVYAGIEYKAGTPEAAKLIAFLRDELGANVDASAAVGIKPMTEKGSKRLVRAAIRHALAQNLPSVTLVHKGNIMKFTEGAFKDWGYQLAREEFGGELIDGGPWLKVKNPNTGKEIVIKDVIADAFLQQILLRPAEYDVIACMNLNGDYISDALAAQVGGIGIAPGANIGDECALFEATHGTAPKYAGQDKVNPGSIILSAEMMLRHMGWTEAADLIVKGMEGAINAKTVTYDFERLMEGAKLLKCSEFGDAIIKNM